MSRSILAGLAVLALALTGACRRAAPPPATGALRAADDAGDTVALARPAARIVSLNPATTELLFAIGAGPAVVGRSTWCDYPAVALAVPSLGDAINPSLEAIVARHPDLVLLYPSGQNAATVAHLRGLGIAVFQARTDLMADVPRLARTLGTLTGRTGAADSLARAYTADLAAATVAPTGPRPGVFILVWDQPPMTVGRGSYLSELMERAGGRNVFGDLATSSAQISIEAVAARDPDLVLTAAGGDPAFADRPEWQTVRAVRERRFVAIPGSEFSRPGPRTPQAIRTLAARLAAAESATAASDTHAAARR